MRNDLLDKLKAGARPVGTFLAVGNPAVAEGLILAGLDYVIIDSEHGPLDVESAVDVMRAVEARGGSALARTKDSSRASILKMLDIGVNGLIIPNVRDVEEVHKIVEHSRFFPVGQRGLNFTRSAGYGLADYARDLGDYMRIANERTLILPQCETKPCVEQIEEIVAVEGIDGVFIGPFDLSVSLGKPGQFNSPEFTGAVRRVQKACAEAGKYCFTFSSDVEAGRRLMAQGFDSLTLSTDNLVMFQAYQKLLTQLRP
ncbi:MAG: host specificity protein [Candidatus Adiutrix sp.]|jgi:4-hydroxy-2-oxoheptanedioate aldolase|nr:host specificity protein [Candidatus Adiutrix sp.]